MPFSRVPTEQRSRILGSEPSIACTKRNAIGPRTSGAGDDVNAASVRNVKTPPEEDDEIDLPPLDDEEDDDKREPLDDDDLLTKLDEESDDPFDDAAAADLETGLDVGDEDDRERADDQAANDSVDVGALEDGLVIRESDSESGDDRSDGVEGEEDADIQQDMRGEDDGGAEGTSENVEDDVNEEDLPGLDADEEGDFEGEDLVVEMSFEDDSNLPPWDALRWAALEGAGATVPCSTLAIAGGWVVAGGEVVLLVDEGAHAARRAGFEGGASSIAISEDAVVVIARREHLWLSKDNGRSASVLFSWRDAQSAALLASTPGRIWILSEGSLWSMPATDSPATQVRSKDVAQIAASGAVLIALTHTDAGPSIERLRSDDEGWQTTRLTGEAERVAKTPGARLAAAAGGWLLAVADKETVCVSRDGGVTFRAIDLPQPAALAFAGEDERAPLLVLLAQEDEGHAWIVLVPAEGSTTRIAELPGSAGADVAEEENDDTLGSIAMGWDSAREVVWIACRAGLVALARTRKH